jgi:hypothetical protein
VSLGYRLHCLFGSRAWREVMTPILDEIDASASKYGPARMYSAQQLEGLIWFMRAANLRSIHAARKALDQYQHADTRAWLNLDEPPAGIERKATRGTRRMLPGVPSEKTICIHVRKRFGLERRAKAVEALTRELRKDAAPLLGAHGSELYLDGTLVIQRGTPFPRRNPKTGEVKKPTLPDAGFVPFDGKNKNHHGIGQNVLVLHTANGMPLAHHVMKLHESEKGNAHRIFREYGQHVRPHLAQEALQALAVLTADGGFYSEDNHRVAVENRLIANIHGTSHAEHARKKAKDWTNRRRAILGKYERKWYANFHHELSCACGRGTTSRIVRQQAGGEWLLAIQGECDSCGGCYIRAGHWRQVKNVRTPSGTYEDAWVPCLPEERAEHGNAAFGNPLTFNDSLSSEYGRYRFPRQEGYFAGNANGNGIFAEKTYFRTQVQVRTAVAEVFSLQLAVGTEQLRWERLLEDAAAGTGPAPPLPVRPKRGEMPPGRALAAA